MPMFLEVAGLTAIVAAMFMVSPVLGVLALGGAMVTVGIFRGRE